MIVGFDATTRDLAGLWVAEGLMPNLSRPVDQGIHGQPDSRLEDNMGTGQWRLLQRRSRASGEELWATSSDSGAPGSQFDGK